MTQVDSQVHAMQFHHFVFVDIVGKWPQIEKECAVRKDGFAIVKLKHFKTCVDSDNLSTAIRSLADTYVFMPIYDNRAMRHAAYRQYIMWQHGHLGKGHRKVIPGRFSRHVCDIQTTILLLFRALAFSNKWSLENY